MTFELAAARILAPTVGSSTYVWTSIIGTIIAALSFGFYVGGRIADARARRRDVMWLLLVASGLIALTTVLYPHVLPWLADLEIDVRAQAVMAALLLFAPTSFVLGTISPYLAKLNVTSLKTAGTAVANLSMWDALGGITGTFLDRLRAVWVCGIARNLRRAGSGATAGDCAACREVVPGSVDFCRHSTLYCGAGAHICPGT